MDWLKANWRTNSPWCFFYWISGILMMLSGASAGLSLHVNPLAGFLTGGYIAFHVITLLEKGEEK